MNTKIDKNNIYIRYIYYFLNSLTGIETLNAYLPIKTAIVYILLSVILNTLSGFIPSKSAARKDPVVALRSE